MTSSNKLLKCSKDECTYNKIDHLYLTDTISYRI